MPESRLSTPAETPEAGSSRSITEAFEERARKGQAALIPYVCAGFPTREESLALMCAAAEEGADIIELGIPFSDPLADGPTIQKATFEALKAGMTVRGALEILREFRSKHDVPVVLFTYLNPIHHFGLEAFVREAASAGARGVLVTDLPVGADPALERSISEGGLDFIRLLAPTTLPSRVRDIADGATGFLYYISRAGVTGARTELRAQLAREVAELKRLVGLPIAVGFGISTPDQAAVVADAADGVVVGSALVDAMERGGVSEGRAFLASLRSAMDRRRD